MAAKSMVDQVMPENQFDRRTHLWDSTGNLVKKNHYVEYVIQGERYLERPVNSGNLWTEGNQPAGRVEKTFGPTGVVSTKKFDFAAEHKVYTPELIGDDQILYQLEQEREARKAAEQELAAIKAERTTVTEKPTNVVSPKAGISTGEGKRAAPTLPKEA